MVINAPRMSRMYMRQRQTKVAAITDFGDWLRRERSSRGLTMEMLSDRADTAPAVVSNLERGTRNPSRDMVTRLAAALAGPEADERTTAALLNAGLRAAGFASLSEVIEVQYEAILDELRSASYSGGLDSRDVSEVAEIIRLKAQRKLERQGRD